jgi:hypothetical protein
VRALRVPVKTVTVGAIVGTAAVVAWLLVHAREDPPRGDRGPVAMPSASSSAASADDAAGDANDARDASAPDAVLIDGS